LGAIADRKFILDCRDPQRSNHHRRQGIGKLTLEHGAFASHYTVMLGNFIEQERRKDVWKMDLGRALEISFRALEILAHDAEINSFSAQNVPDLTQHLLDSHIRSHVSRAVVSGKQQFQFFSRLPRFVSAHHPADFRSLDVAAHPGFEDEIHHAALPPRLEGHGWYLYSKLFSRLNFSSG